MNKFLTLLSFAVVFSTFAVEVGAQWKQLYVGGAGGINAVATIGSNAFAGTNTGIFRSTNSGSSWANVNSSFTLCFTAEGSDIFAGTASGVILSADDGSTWAGPNSGFTYYVTALAAKDTTLFVGTYQNGIFRSSDNGATWIPVDSGLGPYQNLVHGLAVSDTEIFAATAAGLCLSTDDGDSWSTISLPFQNASAMTNCVAAYDSTIMVGTPGGMFRSTDNGNSWSLADGFTDTTSIFSIVAVSPYIYAGTTSGVHLSTDGGENWTAINNGLPGNQVWSVAVSASNLFAGTISNGVFLSTNNGTSWVPANSGIVSSSATFIAGNGHNLFVVMSPPPSLSSSLFASTDDGTTWVPDTSLPSDQILFVTVIDSSVFAVTNNGIFHSTNDGTTWDSINGGVMDTVYPGILVVSGSNLIVSSFFHEVFISKDNGMSWTVADDNMPRIASLATNGSNVFVGGEAGVYLSTDNGESWTQTNDTLMDINTIVTSGSSVFAGRYFWPVPVGVAPTPGGLFRSGLPNQPGGPQVHVLAIHGSDIFAGLDPGLYVSTVNQDNWINIGGGLPSLEVLSLFINDSAAFVGTDFGGIWSRPLSQITSVKGTMPPTAPESFELEQNYPNPFNPTTTISYQLRTGGHVTLKVYDILGREVAALVNAELEAGIYQVTFDGSRLASGVYFYRLTAPGFNQVRKMLLTK